MIRDITIGQYYQADSVIHRLDPRVKLMGTLIFVISLFLGSNIWLYLVVAAFLAIVIALSKIPLKFILKGLKAIVILIVISAAFNLFLTPGTPLIKIWKLTITHEGLNTAVFMVIRLIFLIMGSSLIDTLQQRLITLQTGLKRDLDFLNTLKFRFMKLQ